MKKKEIVLCIDKDRNFKSLNEKSKIYFVDDIPNPIEVMDLLSGMEKGMFCHVLKVELDFNCTDIKNVEYVKSFGRFESFGF